MKIKKTACANFAQVFFVDSDYFYVFAGIKIIEKTL